MVSDECTESPAFLFDIKPRIHFVSDGIDLTPHQYSELLLHLTSDPSYEPDEKDSEENNERLESVFASITGKQKAIFMPTGTMANQLAIRVLSEGKSKVYVQETSHVLNDEGDAAQEMHHKRLMPLAEGKATFSLEDLVFDIEDFRTREVFPTQIGAISIENPVKSMLEEIFDIQEMRKIASFARENGIGMHLDGARLHVASAYSGISVREYSSNFDTVYISLSKYLGAFTGAVLCGPGDVINRMPHLIKILGGKMTTSWNATCVALHFIKGFESRYKKAKLKANRLFNELNEVSGIRVDAISNGSNVYKFSIKHGNYDQFVSYLADQKNIYLRNKTENDHFIPLKVNETLNYISIGAVVSSFKEAYVAST